MLYEVLLEEAFKDGVKVEERDLGNKIMGLYGESVIWINKRIKTYTEKTCVFAEELGHHHTSYGDITDLSELKNRKQEHVARRWAAKKLVSVEIGKYFAICERG